MRSSRLFLSSIDALPAPIARRTTSSPPALSCTGAIDGVACEQAQPTIVYISLAIVLIPILACILMCGCFKIYVIYCREQAAPSNLRQEEAARTPKGEVTMTSWQLDGAKLVILAGGDAPSLMAIPCAVQGQDGSGIWLEKPRDGEEQQAPSLSACVIDLPPPPPQRDCNDETR